MHTDSNPDLANHILALASIVHETVGPGLDAGIYQQCLCIDLSKAGIPFAEHVPVPVQYNDATFDLGYVADLVVQNEVLVQIKAVEEFQPEDDQQLLTYLTFLPCHTGLMLNFNTVSFADDVRRNDKPKPGQFRPIIGTAFD